MHYSMNDKVENDDSIVTNFVQDFYVCYDKNRHVLHSMFTEDGTFILLGNRMSGHAEIQQSMLIMATTTHKLLSVDIQNLVIPLPENVSMFQVHCAGELEFGGDPQIHGFTSTFLVYFKKPNILNVVSLSERCLWPVLS